MNEAMKQFRVLSILFDNFFIVYPATHTIFSAYNSKQPSVRPRKILSTDIAQFSFLQTIKRGLRLPN